MAGGLGLTHLTLATARTGQTLRVSVSAHDTCVEPRGLGWSARWMFEREGAAYADQPSQLHALPSLQPRKAPASAPVVASDQCATSWAWPQRCQTLLTSVRARNTTVHAWLLCCRVAALQAALAQLLPPGTPTEEQILMLDGQRLDPAKPVLQYLQGRPRVSWLVSLSAHPPDPSCGPAGAFVCVRHLHRPSPKRRPPWCLCT
jgi:hypothetical protein